LILTSIRSWNVEIAKPLGNLDVLLHRATEHADLAIELLRDIKDDLQTMNRRSKRRDDNSALASAKISSKAGITARSEGVRPGTVAFVESESSASTPSCPYRRRVLKSIGSPITGVSSTL
jgi:hypothetical protein